MTEQEKIYVQLLENQVKDLEQQVSEMRSELINLSHLIIKYKIPTLQSD